MATPHPLRVHPSSQRGTFIPRRETNILPQGENKKFETKNFPLRKGGKDSIMQYNKERGIHTMKFANRIFLVLGAMSMFSLVQFDAMGLEAYDKSSNCTSGVSAGLYCKKKNNKPSCPAGCWCESGRKDAIGEKHSGNQTIALQTWCKNHTKYLEQYLSDRGVHYCPDEFPKSPVGASSINMCHNESGLYYDTRPGVDCPNEQPEGKFCKNIDFLVPISQDCKPGCYCKGHTKKTVGFRNVAKACDDRSDDESTWSQLNAGGVYLCPENFENSAEGAKTEEECFALLEDNTTLYYKKVLCSVGKYLPKLSNKCQECLNGYRCPGTEAISGKRGRWVPSKTEDKGLYKCDDGKIANPDHTACVSSSGGGSGGNTNCNYTVTYRNNYPISVTANDLRVELSAMDVEERTERFDAIEEVSANLDRVNRSVATQNRQTGLCQGDSVTLRNAPTAPDGYTFNYWDCNQSIGHKMPGATFNMPAGNVICTAQWTQSGNGGGNTDCSYKVEFNKGNTAVSGSVAAITGKCQNDSVYLTTNPSFSWDDHAFNGWSCVNSVNNTSLSISDNHITMPSANVTCTAQWTQSGNGGGSTGAVSCDPGQYWDEDEEDCVGCSTGHFCPGDGEEYSCPLSLSQTSSGASCRGNVSKTQMYGNNCWKYTSNAPSYRNCVYGIRLENYHN